MSNEQLLINLTNLLTKSQMLLMEAYADKEYSLNNSLKEEVYCKPKEAGDLKTLLWIQSRTQKQMEQIGALMCQIDKLTSPPACDGKEQATFTDTEKRAIALILDNERVALNVAKLADKLGQQEHA